MYSNCFIVPKVSKTSPSPSFNPNCFSHHMLVLACSLACLKTDCNNALALILDSRVPSQEQNVGRLLMPPNDYRVGLAFGAWVELGSWYV